MMNIFNKLFKSFWLRRHHGIYAESRTRHTETVSEASSSLFYEKERKSPFSFIGESLMLEDSFPDLTKTAAEMTKLDEEALDSFFFSY